MATQPQKTQAQAEVAKPRNITAADETVILLDNLKVEVKNIYNIDLKDYNSLIVFLLNSYYKK